MPPGWHNRPQQQRNGGMAMRSWRLRAGVIVTLIAFALGACGVKAEPADPAVWAAGVCGAEQRFYLAIAESRDNQDPSGLELAERKERATRLGEIEIAAAKELADDLDAIEPPEGAKEYHDALLTQANDVVKAVEGQLKAIEEATTAQQIAVANASAKFDLQGSNTELTAAAATVPEDIVEVLVTQTECGAAPIPGEPTAPAATPAV